MWVVIDVDKGEIIHLTETKKEALAEAQLQRYLDKFIHYKNKYVVIKEEEI